LVSIPLNDLLAKDRLRLLGTNRRKAKKCGLSEIQSRQKSAQEIAFSSPRVKLTNKLPRFSSIAKSPQQLALNFSPHFDYLWR
jgi:hypothetical protein